MNISRYISRCLHIHIILYTYISQPSLIVSPLYAGVAQPWPVEVKTVPKVQVQVQERIVEAEKNGWADRIQQVMNGYQLYQRVEGVNISYP